MSRTASQFVDEAICCHPSSKAKVGARGRPGIPFRSVIVPPPNDVKNQPEQELTKRVFTVPITVQLPTEILLQIFSYLPFLPTSPAPESATVARDLQYQHALHACTLVSRSWYYAANGLLYDAPSLNSHNFKAFTSTICPSVNARIRKNGLADLVRVLDLGRLIHDGSKSLTARLLSRVKDRVEIFVAPQATFG